MIQRATHQNKLLEAIKCQAEYVSLLAVSYQYGFFHRTLFVSRTNIDCTFPVLSTAHFISRASSKDHQEK